MTTAGTGVAGAATPPGATDQNNAAWRRPWAAGLLCGLLVLGGFALGIQLPNLHNGLIAASFTAVGVFVVGKRPGNREGWLFIATGLAHVLLFLPRQVGFHAATHAGPTLPGVTWVTWLGVWPLPLVLALVGLTLMCVDDGPTAELDAAIAATEALDNGSHPMR